MDNLTPREQRRLQRLIDKAVSTGKAAKEAHDNLMEYCLDRYGVEPGDVDADGIIDALGGCGYGRLDAMDFDAEMRGIL